MPKRHISSQVFYAFVLTLNISSNTLPSQGPKSMPKIAAIVGAISTIWISPNLSLEDYSEWRPFR